jgi:hypothetical protein
MSVINTGKTFANGEQLTADKLNQVINQATFNASEAVDGSTITLISGAMAVNDSGITEAKIGNGAVTKAKLATDALELAYPVGSIYMNASNSNNPSTLLGFGTWSAFGAGRVPVGIDSSDTNFDTAEETGGAKTHTLDLDEMPSHRHGGIYPAGSAGSFTQGFDVDNATSGNTLSEEKFTTYTGGDKTDGTQGTTQAHNNLQPYIVVYMWKRTA